MEMYCRDCNKIVRVTKIKDKDFHTKDKSFFCKECGVMIMRIYSNRRRS